MILRTIASMRDALLLAISLLFILAPNSNANAQSDLTSTLRIANSTNATLTIIVNRKFGGGNPQIIKIPPITERTMIVPAGLVTFTAVAKLSSPEKTLSKEQTFTRGRSYEINLTPQAFGTTFLADRPSSENQTGITANQSRLALSGRACAEDEPANATRYKWRTTGQGSFYWKNGDVFCGTYNYDFAVIADGQLAYFKCKTRSFVYCTRQPGRYVIDSGESSGLKKMTGPYYASAKHEENQQSSATWYWNRCASRKSC